MHRYMIYYRPQYEALRSLRFEAYTAEDALVAAKVQFDAQFPGKYPNGGYTLERLECLEDLSLT